MNLEGLRKLFVATFSGDKDNYTPYTNVGRYYNSKLHPNSLLWVCWGEVVVEKCLFSFKLLTKSLEE